MLPGFAHGDTYTATTCKGTCSKAVFLAAAPDAGNSRSLGNKATPDYRGFTDVWANNGATVMSTNMKVDNGQVWPRIAEGVGAETVETPGYPIKLSTYLQKSTCYIDYKGGWTARNQGPFPRPSPTGPRYNGAYMWLNKENNFHTPQNPKWPFTVEVNIWNRYDYGVDDVKYFGEYHDTDGTYTVSGGLVDRAVPKEFFAYFVVNKSKPGHPSMNINTIALLKWLRDNAGLDPNLLLIEIAVAAEGHPGTDGKFTADITTMGRPSECK